MKAEIILTKDVLNVLTSMNRVYSFLTSKFKDAYIKLESGNMTFTLCSNDGMIATHIPLNYEGDTIYFSVDYIKWYNALLKYQKESEISVKITDNMLKLYILGSLDEINLGIVTYDSMSLPARQIDEFLPQKKKEIVDSNHLLTVNNEIKEDFILLNNLFTTQGRTNSIAISKEYIMYSDRSVVTKANLSSELPDSLFDGMEEGKIYLHKYILKLIDSLCELNNNFYFDNSGEVMYWGDGTTDLIIYSESKYVALPSDDEFLMIQPQDKDTYFNVSVSKFKESLDMFLGFYSDLTWKPVKFSIAKDEDITLSYSHPTSAITKTLSGVKGTKDGSFILAFETMSKILSKLPEKEGENDVIIHVVYDAESVPSDERAPGVFWTVGDKYEFALSLLEER